MTPTPEPATVSRRPLTPVGPITRRQLRLLTMFREHVEQHGRSPLQKHIAAALGVSRPAVSSMFKALGRAGHLVQRERGWWELPDQEPHVPDDPGAPHQTCACHLPALLTTSSGLRLQRVAVNLTAGSTS